ncbi:uncharacterized protein LOC142556419 [Primulina tabacum]|uniref:uncharacterized protein LOC142556419 n=1 Tax=Primulina tabacum TaxID=48773 RepID=UPI003F5A3DA3
MAKAFLIKYFPPSKTMKLRANITTFAQFEQKSLYEALEHFKDLLRRCPHHELPLGLVVQTFYYGLLTPNRTMIDDANCGNLLRKTAEEGYELLGEMATSSYHPQSERNNQRRKGAPVNQVGVQNRPKNDPYSNTYNHGWRQHPNFSWGGQNSQNQPQGGQSYGKQPMYRSDPPREEKSNLEQMMSKFISSIETRLQNQDTSIKGLENHIGQLAKMIANREPDTLPSNTKTNPKEQVKAIELKSGNVLESKEKERNQVLDEQTESSKALKKAKLDAQFGKFLEVFKKLHINILFAEALMQMPRYVKFLKDILANKRKLKDHMTVNLIENCSALVQNKIPPKLKDLGRNFGLGELKPTRLSLQLADISVKYPRGVIEDVLVKVDRFIFPADFVVLDMEEDIEMPLILGRPFLATGKALIDVQEGKLRLRVGEEEITFDVFNALKHTLDSDSCYRLDAFDYLVFNYVQDALRDPLEATLTTESREDELNVEKAEIVAYLNANQQWKRPIRMRLEDLGDRRDLIPQKSSLEEPPTLELKPLPPHLKYVYLGENNKLPVIISSSLIDVMEDKLLKVLKAHKSAFS